MLGLVVPRLNRRPLKITKPRRVLRVFHWRKVPRTAEEKEGCNYRRQKHLIGFLFAVHLVNVRYWHKADMGLCAARVRFWGKADMLMHHAQLAKTLCAGQ